ncbi:MULTISPECIES: amidohydrolase [unclassified Clostridium]|uniref:amidohydrolase n=1 Tax=unclassified Clostridium TaxID=2614128 RepID=UPI001FAAC99A|nr:MULTISPECIES: amidohydrolase [unclassified Clostridium]
MILIENATVWTMTGPPIAGGSVLVREGKIAAVGRDIALRDTQDLQRIDAAGGWVLPGLVEAHCHIGISEERVGGVGDDCNELVTPLTPSLRAVDAVNPMDSAFHNALAAGITTVMTGPGSANVVGGQFVALKTHGRNIAEMVLRERAALKVAFGENPKTNYGGKGNAPATRMAIAAMLREALNKARDYLNEKQAAQKAGRSFKVDYQQEAYLPVLRGEIPLKAHVHRADDILTAIRIAKEFGLKMTLDHCTEGHLIAREVAASGFPAIVGPSLASRSKVEVENLDFKTAGVLRKAGVEVAICSDHPVTLIQYLPIYAGLAAREGLGQAGALRAITAGAARILGVDHRVGTLQAGKDADIAIFSGNPLETATCTLYTLVNGQVVYDRARDGER